VMTSADELRERLGKPASRGVVGGFRPPADPLTSWLGRVRVLGRDEAWPEHRGELMAGICQINVSELPHVPAPLRDVALVTLFLGLEAGVPWPPSDAANGEGWELRAYPAIDDLAPAEGPTAPDVDAFPVRWELIEADLPSWEDANRFLTDADIDEWIDRYTEAMGGPVDGLKVGGWPTLIQGEIFWAPWQQHPADPEFVFQVDSDEKTGLACTEGSSTSAAGRCPRRRGLSSGRAYELDRSRPSPYRSEITYQSVTSVPGFASSLRGDKHRVVA
jgi:Domain of unknown function (DUF1963)